MTHSLQFSVYNGLAWQRHIREEKQFMAGGRQQQQQARTAASVFLSLLFYPGYTSLGWGCTHTRGGSPHYPHPELCQTTQWTNSVITHLCSNHHTLNPRLTQCRSSHLWKAPCRTSWAGGGKLYTSHSKDQSTLCSFSTFFDIFLSKTNLHCLVYQNKYSIS